MTHHGLVRTQPPMQGRIVQRQMVEGPVARSPTRMPTVPSGRPVAKAPRRTQHIYQPQPIARTSYAPSDEAPE